MKSYIIIERRKPEDWLFGGDHGLDKMLMPKSALYLPTVESQRFHAFDPWWCVSASALNCLEYRFNYYLAENKIKPENKKWLLDNGYLDAEGKVNFDDWFLARVSNTVPGKGNSFFAVAEAIRKNGLTPQTSSPFDMDYYHNSEKEYYQNIPDRLYDLGQEFLKRFTLNYEIVYPSQFYYALDYGPLQAGVSAWLKKDNVYVSNGQIIHAVTLFNNFPYLVFDTYSPFVKQLADNYIFLNYAYSWYVTENANTLIKNLMDYFLRLKNGAIFWGKSGTNKVQKITEQNAGLAAITHIMRQPGADTKNILDEDLKRYVQTEEFFGGSKSIIKKLFRL
jgi:hypothetical protein